MGGDRLKAALLTTRGIPGDRGWAVYDETRQGITGAKRLPSLRACRARYLSEPISGGGSPPVEITLPDGSGVLSESPEAARRLGELLGRRVSLRALGPVGSEAAPRVTTQSDPTEDVRELSGLLPGEPMADMREFPPERLRALRQGNFFDALPLHLITQTTLRTLAQFAPESIWDERRFRPNLFVKADEPEGYPELGWIGHKLRVGTIVIDVVAGCPRCVMVTQPCEDLPQDPRVMRTIVRETKHVAGIYAQVIAEGEVREGDEIELLN